MEQSTTAAAIAKHQADIRTSSQIVTDTDQLRHVMQAADVGGNSGWKDVNNFWNPGPATLRENIKLRCLHGLTVGSGCLRPVLGRLATSTFGILTYHRITESQSTLRSAPVTRPSVSQPPVTQPSVTRPSINVSPQQFRKQLSGLQNSGFKFCSLSDITNKFTQPPEQIGGFPERLVAVTFDDIYDNVFHNAWPVLQELRIPATVFVSTAFPDSAEPFPFDHWARQFRDDVPETDWRPIQSKHLQQMLDSDLIEIGAHTHTHQDFRNRPSDFAKDLQRNLEELTERFCVDQFAFAFPYGVPRLGFANEQLMHHVQNTNLTCGLTTGSHTNTFESSPFGWGRFHVFDHDTVASLAAKLDGYYQWLPALKNKAMSAFRR